jgi:hypothetical protein
LATVALAAVVVLGITLQVVHIHDLVAEEVIPAVVQVVMAAAQASMVAVAELHT